MWHESKGLGPSGPLCYTRAKAKLKASKENAIEPLSALAAYPVAGTPHVLRRLRAPHLLRPCHQQGRHQTVHALRAALPVRPRSRSACAALIGRHGAEGHVAVPAGLRPWQSPQRWVRPVLLPTVASLRLQLTQRVDAIRQLSAYTGMLLQKIHQQIDG